MKVLYFAAWYPDRYDAMSGLFVRKHAEAVSRYCDVAVLYPVADDSVRTFEIVECNVNGVVEVHVYYPYVEGILRKPSKLFNYVRAFVKGYKYLLSRWGKPDITQANVMTRCATLSYMLKVIKGIPYVVVEHWSRYLPDDLHYKGWLRKRVTERVVKEAGCVLAVSQVLKEAMISHNLTNSRFRLINNVVDESFYQEPSPRRDGKVRILHVSCFDEPSKNMKGILEAVKLLSEHTSDFELNIVGDGVDYDMIVSYAEELHLTDQYVHFKGLMSPQEVGREMAESDFFVLFSNFETASVVVCEALASGLPIVTSAVCQIPMMIRPEVDMLVPARDVKALSEAMLSMMSRCRNIDRTAIRDEGLKYSYPVVGRYLSDIYEEVLTDK